VNQTKISVAVLAASAGLACSAALAGDVDGSFSTQAPKAPIAVQGNVKFFKESDFKIAEVAKMYVNGQQVPFVQSETIEGLSAGTDDGVGFLAYDNTRPDNSGTLGGYFLGTISGSPINAALDDVTLGGGASGATNIGGLRVRFATATDIPAADSFWVGLQWWDGFNNAGTPVNTNLKGTFLLQNASAGTGWATGAVYRTRYVNSAFLPLDFTTAGTSGAVEWLSLADNAGVPDTIVYPFVRCVLSSAATPTVGSTTNGIYFANNVLDSNGNGAYNGPAVTFVDGASNPIVSNIGFSLVAMSTGSGYQACCLPGAPTGGCVVLKPAVCTAQGGVVKAQATCALPDANKCAGLAAGTIFNNGPLGTGTTVVSGANVAAFNAIAGAVWDETPLDIGTGGGKNPCVNNLIGGGVSALTQKVGDDFVVPTGETWNVTGIKLYNYRTGDTSTRNPLDTATISIWKGFPDAVGSTRVAGDDVTLLTPTASTALAMFRTGSTWPAVVPGITRRVWENTFSITASGLTAGQYYVTWNIQRAGATPFQPLLSVMTAAPAITSTTPPTFTGAGGTVDLGAGNAVLGFFQGDGSGTNPGTWGHEIDNRAEVDGANATNFDSSTCLPYTAELPFGVVGTKVVAPSCYANCDGSTTAPVLSAADFTCFLNKFRASDSYANCDGSTTAPVLSAADFTCFLTKFRAGCP